MTKKSKSQPPIFLSVMDDVTEMMLGFRMNTKRRNLDGDVIDESN